MRTITTSFAVLLACATATPALAVDVISGSVQLTPANATQLGRLARNGVQQDWTGSEPFPGIINPTLKYEYTTVAAPFAPNALQTVYYDITIDDEINDLFASAYLDSYDPTDLMKNWLGDAGSSGNPFPNDPAFFDVVVPTGHSLVLVFNAPAAGAVTTSSAIYNVYAFSSTEYDENFLSPAVPEPATWGLMILGFAGIGAMLRAPARRGARARPRPHNGRTPAGGGRRCNISSVSPQTSASARSGERPGP